jgi:AcrR family transcriptional regulator
MNQLEPKIIFQGKFKSNANIDKICKKAAQLFNEKGYLSTTLVEISKASGLSKGGIFHYFPTKELLLFYILNQCMEQITDGLKRSLKDNYNPYEKIRVFIQNHIDFYCNNFHEARVILHETQNLPPGYWKILRKKTKAYYNFLKSNINDLMDRRNKRNPEKAKLLANFLLGMCNWIYWWYDPKGRISPEELADEIYKIFVAGLSK